MPEHIEAKTKWIPFCRWHLLKFIFFDENLCILIQISLKFIPKAVIGGTKPWPEQILTYHQFKVQWLRVISPETPQPWITKINLKIAYLAFHSNLPGTNELTFIWLFTDTDPVFQLVFPYISSFLRYLLSPTFLLFRHLAMPEMTYDFAWINHRSFPPTYCSGDSSQNHFHYGSLTGTW